MKLVLLLLATALLAAASPRRVPRQTWSFPGEEENTRPDSRPPTRPTRRTTTTRTTTVRGGSTSPTPSPNVIFQVSCPCPAPPQYNPVCGDDGSTYSNRQVLDCARTCGANVQFVRLGVCATPRR